MTSKIQTDSELLYGLVKYYAKPFAVIEDLIKSRSFGDAIHGEYHLCLLKEDPPTEKSLRPKLQEKDRLNALSKKNFDKKMRFEVLETELILPIGFLPSNRLIYGDDVLRENYRMLAYAIFNREARTLMDPESNLSEYTLFEFQLNDSHSKPDYCSSYAAFFRLAIAVPSSGNVFDYGHAHKMYTERIKILSDCADQYRRLGKTLGETVNDVFEELLRLPNVFANCEKPEDISNLAKLFEIAKCAKTR